MGRPFLRVVGADPRCYVRFTHDGHGHVPIPPGTIREILGVLASDRTAAVDAAGFSPASDVSSLTGQFLPEIAQRLDSLGKENRRLGRERDALEVQQVKFQERVAELRSRSDALDNKIQALNHRVEHLRTEPPLWRRMWHVEPRSFRERLQRFIRGKHA